MNPCKRCGKVNRFCTCYRCLACGNKGSHGESGREWCSSCGSERTRRNSGFTLIELVIVVAVGVLAALAIAVVSQMLDHRSQETVTGPDGKPALLIECSESANCFRAAAKACPGGYATVTQHEESGTSTVWVGGNDTLIPVTTPTWNGSLMIRCHRTQN